IMNSYGNLFYMIYNAFSLRWLNTIIPAPYRNFINASALVYLLLAISLLIPKTASFIIQRT
ncbi:hypothetical protein RO706_25805, partial [Bacteroides koreensis]